MTTQGARGETGEWLTRKEAAAYLESIGCGVSPQTLANMAANDNKGGGPPFRRNGWRIVRYRKSDLDVWAKTRITDIP